VDLLFGSLHVCANCDLTLKALKDEMYDKDDRRMSGSVDRKLIEERGNKDKD